MRGWPKKVVSGSGQGFFYLPWKRVDVIQSGKKLVTDETGVDTLVVMGQKIALLVAALRIRRTKLRQLGYAKVSL